MEYTIEGCLLPLVSPVQSLSHWQTAATWPWPRPPEVHTLSRANANELGHTGPCDRTESSRAISWCLFEADLWFQTSCLNPPRAHTGANHQRYPIEGVDEPTWAHNPHARKVSKTEQIEGQQSAIICIYFSLLTFSLTSSFLGSCLDRAKRPEHITKQSAGLGRWRWRWDWQGLESWLPFWE